MSDLNRESAMEAVRKVMMQVPQVPIDAVLRRAGREAESSETAKADAARQRQARPPAFNPEIKILLALMVSPLGFVDLRRRTSLNPGTLSRCLGQLIDAGEVTLEVTEEGRFFTMQQSGVTTLTEEARKANMVLNDLARLVDPSMGSTGLSLP